MYSLMKLDKLCPYTINKSRYRMMVVVVGNGREEIEDGMILV